MNINIGSTEFAFLNELLPFSSNNVTVLALENQILVFDRVEKILGPTDTIWRK